MFTTVNNVKEYTDADVVKNKKLYFLYPSNDWEKSTIQYWKTIL